MSALAGDEFCKTRRRNAKALTGWPFRQHCSVALWTLLGAGRQPRIDASGVERVRAWQVATRLVSTHRLQADAAVPKGGGLIEAHCFKGKVDRDFKSACIERLFDRLVN